MADLVFCFQLILLIFSVPPQPPKLNTLPTTQALTPMPCIGTRWSKWINRDKPSIGDGDHESLTPAEMSVFCAGGRISRIECVTESGIPDYSSGEITSCSVNNGFECLNVNNFPVPCSDYKVRYFCDCTSKYFFCQFMGTCEIIAYSSALT